MQPFPSTTNVNNLYESQPYKEVSQFNPNFLNLYKMNNPNVLKGKSPVPKLFSRPACIMKSIDPYSATQQDEDDDAVIDRLESLNINLPSLNPRFSADSKSILLLDGNEYLRVSSEKDFLQRLRIGDDVEKIKVVSIFGNTGEGKSYTLNHVFFNGENVFRTSPEQSSCTLGVWAAYDPVLKVICLDTEGLLGVTKKENQRTRLLLKILAVSDIIIFRTRAERLQRDMYTFLGGASQAFNEHFNSALRQLQQASGVDQSIASSLGPSVIIFHETRHTNTLQSSAGVSESPEDILRSAFAQLQLDLNAFSSLKYIGVRTKGEESTSFNELRNALQLELENTTVRSARNPKFIYLTLKGLNEKFKSEITNSTPQLYLPAYFTCQVKCQSCNTGCMLSMGHVDEGKPHSSSLKCQFQHQYQNCVHLCKRCYSNGERIIVKAESISENNWSSLFTYVWSGYVIECRKCGEIYRSRQHWYGNKDPEESAVIPEIVHVWPGSEFSFQERGMLWSQNSAQRVLDGVNMISKAVASVGAPPTRAIASWVNDKIAPSYWKPDHLIKHCHKCKTSFQPNITKHHCRKCGEGFCDSCSGRYQPVPSRGWLHDVRVCDDCYEEAPGSIPPVTDDSEVKARRYGEAVVNSIAAVASVFDIPKGLIKDSARPSYWTPDEECLNCECCRNPFGTLIPLHHCRDCGKGVCDDCSNSRKPVPHRGWDWPVRVCDKCAV